MGLLSLLSQGHPSQQAPGHRMAQPQSPKLLQRQQGAKHQSRRPLSARSQRKQPRHPAKQLVSHLPAPRQSENPRRCPLQQALSSCLCAPLLWGTCHPPHPPRRWRTPSQSQRWAFSPSSAISRTKCCMGAGACHTRVFFTQHAIWQLRIHGSTFLYQLRPMHTSSPHSALGAPADWS